MEEYLVRPNATVAEPATLSIKERSHMKTKLQKPKIRIVHIFAPEIIKTDASNFREIVQRLTGKPDDRKTHTGCHGKKKKVAPSQPVPKVEQMLLPATCERRWGMEEEEEVLDLDRFIHGLSDYSLVPLGTGTHADQVLFGEAPHHLFMFD